MSEGISHSWVVSVDRILAKVLGIRYYSLADEGSERLAGVRAIGLGLNGQATGSDDQITLPSERLGQDRTVIQGRYMRLSNPLHIRGILVSIPRIV